LFDDKESGMSLNFDFISLTNSSMVDTLNMAWTFQIAPEVLLLRLGSRRILKITRSEPLKGINVAWAPRLKK
jgi:hypothetical protein